MHLGPHFLCSHRTTNEVPPLPAGCWSAKGQCITSAGKENQLSRYTRKKKSHNVFCEKTLVFSHPLQLRFRYSLRIVSAMDKPSKRRHAKSALSSKEDMESELNRKLPKLDSGVPAHSAPLTEEGFAPVEVQSSSAPTFYGTSNMEPQGFYPDEGYDYGARYGGYQATHFNSTLVNDEEADARANFRYHRHRQSAQTAEYVGAYSAPYSDPSARSRGFRATRRERARRLRSSIASSASWSTWSDNRRHLLPLRRHLRRSFTRLSAKVSFIYLFH
jgi:hypothetical protein